jgi:MinD-like ATPase involved in chromosome partitioning or flagellar assembly/CheY-like chemotaxis protein
MAPSDQVRLLLVEDVPQVAQYVRGLLNAQNQVRLVDVVADGSQALAQIVEQRPDVVVVDGLLQGRLRGMQLVRLLQESGLDVPVIVLTVPQHPLTADPSKGIAEVLSMPFNGYDLLSRVLAVNKAAVAAAEHGPSRIVVVFAPKGGVGRTTIAFNLAVAATGLGVRTVLVDGSIQFADVRALLRVPDSAPSMLDLPTDRVSESDLADVLWRDGSGVDVLLAPPRVEMAEMVLARDVEKTLSLLRRLYDLIIVDTGVALDEVTLGVLDQADTILHVVTYDATTIRNTAAMAETFAKIGYPPSKIRYLLNRADATAGIDPADLRRALGRDPEYRLRSEGQVVGPASNQGLAFVTSDPGAGVSRDLVEVARELVGGAVAAGRPTAAAAR